MFESAIEAFNLVLTNKGFSQDDTDKAIILIIFEEARKGISSNRKSELEIQLNDIYDKRYYDIVQPITKPT